ncbi:hypothetical protein CBL_00872 [Carabus blaptoides fortunei]
MPMMYLLTSIEENAPVFEAKIQVDYKVNVTTDSGHLQTNNVQGNLVKLALETTTIWRVLDYISLDAHFMSKCVRDCHHEVTDGRDRIGNLPTPSLSSDNRDALDVLRPPTTLRTSRRTIDR